MYNIISVVYVFFFTETFVVKNVSLKTYWQHIVDNKYQRFFNLKDNKLKLLYTSIEGAGTSNLENI